MLKTFIKFIKKDENARFKNLVEYFWIAKARGFTAEEKDFIYPFSRKMKIVKTGNKIELLFNFSFVKNVILGVYDNKVSTFLMRVRQMTLPDLTVVIDNTSYYPLGYMLLSVALLERNLSYEHHGNIEDTPVFNYTTHLSIENYIKLLKKSTDINIERAVESFYVQLTKTLEVSEEFNFFKEEKWQK